MNVNFFVTCIGDALKSRMARDSVLLLEKLGCRVNFPEKQGCCGQPAINSGYIKEAIPGMKNLIAALEDNDDPIISPAGSCTYAVKSGNDSNLLIVFYVQIMPDDFVMQLHRF